MQKMNWEGGGDNGLNSGCGDWEQVCKWAERLMTKKKTDEPMHKKTEGGKNRDTWWVDGKRQV